MDAGFSEWRIYGKREEMFRRVASAAAGEKKEVILLLSFDHRSFYSSITGKAIAEANITSSHKQRKRLMERMGLEDRRHRERQWMKEMADRRDELKL